jgi:hypothetical protein
MLRPLVRDGDVKAVQQSAGDMIDADEIGKIHYSLLSKGMHSRAVEVCINAVIS